jgi:hypothetical protein
VFPFVSLKVLVRLFIVLPELPNDVLADISVVLLDLARDLHLIFRRHGCHLSSLTHQVEHKLGEITTCDGDMLDRAANNVTFCDWNNVSYTISRIDDGSSETAVGDTVGRPGGSEGEHSLDGDIETLDIERFKHDFCCLFAILGGVEWGFSLV